MSDYTGKQLSQAAADVYGYDAEDWRIIRELAKSDPDGLRLALESDPLIRQRLEWGW